ncbi:sulfatase-like hydrolase/transferase [Hymenobacter aerilatus]|uniref:Sulfatase-like hydrolase/transferase n=1 Tax=Hymenobacter aerilatus TaxID=2932251 RepID=A0A8T9SYC6_9BACT|nr:alkaline phosphatase family protein [Hymenobacter aerilatus]UOR06707.1 sulfatase-like hydrolase/transferase [Hymenobacter aerilatus]
MNTTRFAFQPRYFLFWLLFFVVAKLLFLVYQWADTAMLPLSTVARIFGYGLRLDASATAYLCLLPFALLTLGGLLGPNFRLERLVRGFSAVAGVVVSFLSVADLALYQAWGFRLDATPLQYLNTPGEMAASAASAPLLLLVALFIGLLLVGWLLYKGVVGRLPPLPLHTGRGRTGLIGALYMLLLVVPLRGGLQQIPINQSDVYFSPQPFANHAAVNVPWNVMNSLFLQNAGPNPYHFMPDTTASRLVAALYHQPDSAAVPPTLLRTPRPNVLFIILESFTAKLVGSLGGETGVTPTLDSLSHTGVRFSQVYAAGDRSQKGLVALLSGYPNQPTTSIIKYPRKTERLPQLVGSLRAAGYSSHYYYGGELAFANMKSYLVAGGYDALTERADFQPAEQNSKWGAHDHVLFQRILTDLEHQRQPFFVTAFTLSSHEPFDVPMRTRFPGTSEASLFRNSIYYTDHVLGQFLRVARQQPWWQNTLVVLVADHGHPQPGNTRNYAPKKFHIPLVLAGGALLPAAQGRTIDVLGSQTDVAATLLGQLGLPAVSYPFSRDLLRPTTRPFAFYCFTDGFGLLTPQDTVVYDNVGRRVIRKTPGTTAAQLQLGQAYQQVTFEDFLRK